MTTKTRKKAQSTAPTEPDADPNPLASMMAAQPFMAISDPMLPVIPGVMPGLTTASAAGPPNGAQLRADVTVLLAEAITISAPVTTSQINKDFVPKDPPARFDLQGWHIALAYFIGRLHEHNKFYMFFSLQPKYGEETIILRFPEIVKYLVRKIIAQFNGDE